MWITGYCLIGLLVFLLVSYLAGREDKGQAVSDRDRTAIMTFCLCVGLFWPLGLFAAVCYGVLFVPTTLFAWTYDRARKQQK